MTAAEAQRKYRASEKYREARAKWVEENRERMREHNRAYRLRNPDAVAEKNKRDLERMRQERPQASMYYNARNRARKGGYPCTITMDDIVIPAVCPVLGIPLQVGTGRDNLPNAPTLDKIDPSLGYVPGNVQVISRKANAVKQDATREELLKFAAWVNRSIE